MWGVIDIGSNSIRLVMYQVRKGRLFPMLNKKYSAGLASYVDKDNRLSPAGVSRAAEILLSLRQLAGHIGLSELFPFATASLRNVSNTEEVLGALQERSGLEIRS